MSKCTCKDVAGFHAKDGSHFDDCPKRKQNIIKSKDKQIQDLNDKIAEIGNASIAIDAERNDAHRLLDETEKERDILNERLARMGEALETASIGVNVLHHGFTPPSHWTTSKSRKKTLEALYTHDPDWFKARIREAKAEAFIEASEMIVEMKLNGGTIAGTIAPVRVLAKQYRQPKEARDKTHE